jgi:16S rRNA (guanine966-N2)-methyltransferase
VDQFLAETAKVQGMRMRRLSFAGIVANLALARVTALVVSPSHSPLLKFNGIDVRYSREIMRRSAIRQGDGDAAESSISSNRKKDESLSSGTIKAPRPLKGDMRSKWGTKKVRRRSNQGQALEAGMTNPSRLRVMGGTARGRRLDSPDVQLRPMMGKVKEALFSTLNGFGVFDEPNVRVLDLFSGSGSVGIESLSRGASCAVFVDFAPECVAVAEKNAAWCGFGHENGYEDTFGVCARVDAVLENPAQFGLHKPFDLITVTPPYEEVVYSKLTTQLGDSPLVAEDTIVVLEYPTELGSLPPTIGKQRLVGVRNRRYGRTVLGIYVCNPSGKWLLDIRSEEFIDV